MKDPDTVPVQVRDIKVGDMVDLEDDEHLGHYPATTFEFAEVIEINQESVDCIVLYFDGMAAGYEPGQIMSVKNKGG